MRIAAIIPAAGTGRRFEKSFPKQFLSLREKPILTHTIQKIHDCDQINEIFLIVSKDKIKYCREEIVRKNNFSKIKKIVTGGRERQDSVYNGIKELDSDTDLVVIHDGVRPFVSSQIFLDVIEEAREYGAATVAVPEVDTIKEVSPEGIVIRTLNREHIWKALTPQAFKFDILKKAFEKAFKEGYYATDDASIVEWAGYQVKIVKGSPYNIKITTQEDLALGETMLRIRSNKLP